METTRIRITSARRSMSKAEEIGHQVIAIADIASTLHAMIDDAKMRQRELRDHIEDQLTKLNSLGIEDYKDIKEIRKITKYTIKRYGHREQSDIDSKIKARYRAYLSMKK